MCKPDTLPMFIRLPLKEALALSACAGGENTPAVATAEAEAIAEAEAAAAPETAPSSIDIVCGLHCCGGLSERALELAIHASAHFAVCTCCFCSNPELASLTHSYAASLTHSYADSSYARSISAADSSPTDKGTTIEGDGGAAGAGGGTKEEK